MMKDVGRHPSHPVVKKQSNSLPVSDCCYTRTAISSGYHHYIWLHSVIKLNEEYPISLGHLRMPEDSPLAAASVVKVSTLGTHKYSFTPGHFIQKTLFQKLRKK